MFKLFIKFTCLEMTTLRPFRVADLFKFNRINFDPLTETYGTSFYFHYFAKWPDYFTVAENASSGKMMGYIMGKSEGINEKWHGHVTAVTVTPDCRKIGLANTMMRELENISDNRDCKFVDLYVRSSNKQAIKFYEKMGYFVYQTVRDYYTSLDDPDDTEDAY